MMTCPNGGFTRADLAWFPDDGNRYELLGGHVLVTPAPVPRHQLAVVRLCRAFEDAGCYALPAPVDVVFSDTTVLEPDVCVWLEPFDVRAAPPTPVPDIVVEVSSPSTRRRDLGMKRDRYAAEGIREYWFVDLEQERVLVHHLRDDGTWSVEDGDPATSSTVDLTVPWARVLDT